MTKVVAINGSPYMDKGNTHVILEPFLEGMKEAGSEVELFYTKKLDIKPCQGGFTCWNKTPGQCWQKDDMQWLVPKIGQSDILVVATPLYLDGVSGPMKMLVDRMLPMIQGLLELRDGHQRHPLREEYKQGKLVLVSNCGLWEMDNFDPMVAHIKAICKNISREYAGALLRPHGAGLKVMKDLGVPLEDILEASRDAGRQLVRDGLIRDETLETVSREIMSSDMYLDAVNSFITPPEAATQV